MSMAKSIGNIRKKPGRPKTYRVPVLVRLDSNIVKVLDKYRKDSTTAESRPEAVRKLVRYGLSSYARYVLGLNI